MSFEILSPIPLDSLCGVGLLALEHPLVELAIPNNQQLQHNILQS